MTATPTIPSLALDRPAAPLSADARRRDRAVLLVCWAILAATQLAVAFAPLPAGLSTDDAMRLVTVRDWLQGQAWYDPMQYRLGPNGLAMHWSRLIDLPIGGLISAFALVLPTPSAEKLTMAVWPLLVLLPVLAGMQRLGRELGGRAAGNVGLALGALFAGVVGHFRLGALDHHGVQLALLLWAAIWIMRPTARSALAAGLAMGLSVAIGLEMLPAIATMAMMVGLRWMMQGEAAARPTIGFGLGFAASLLLGFIGTVSPAHWRPAVCDAISAFHVVSGVLGGLGLAGASRVASSRSLALRIGCGVAVGAGAIGLAGLLFPQCLANPYATIDPRLVDIWLNNVGETQSFTRQLMQEPGTALALYAPLFAGVALAWTVALRRKAGSWPWIVAAAVVSALTAIALWEVRSAAGAAIVAVALTAPACATLLPLRRGDQPVFGLRAQALLLAVLLAPITVQLAVVAVEGLADRLGGRDGAGAAAALRAECLAPPLYAPLASLPAGRVLAFIDSGPAILMQSQHTVLAAPYHRNNAGNLAMLDLWTADVATAPAQLARQGIDYVAVCDSLPELRMYRKIAPNGLAAQFVDGRAPDFVAQALSSGPLRVFRVKKDR